MNNNMIIGILPYARVKMYFNVCCISITRCIPKDKTCTIENVFEFYSRSGRKYARVDIDLHRSVDVNAINQIAEAEFNKIGKSLIKAL